MLGLTYIGVSSHSFRFAIPSCLKSTRGKEDYSSLTPHHDVRLLNAHVLSKLKCDNKVKVTLNPNLFKPPKYVHDYFYYTIIANEWTHPK